MQGLINEKLINEIKGFFKGEILKNFKMARATSLKIGGKADYFFYPYDTSSAFNLIRFMKKEKQSLVVLGFGTNVLVLDGGIKGPVVGLKKINRIKLVSETSDFITVYAEAGVSLAKLVSFVSDKSFTGLEFAVNIPGSVGGALMMNAGAFGCEIKEAVKSVTFIDKKGNLKTRKKDDLKFEYRDLNEPDIELITDAEFVFAKGDRKKILQTIENYKKERKAKQPYSFPTAGSVFKNPEGDYAGRLIEAAGLKGYRIGGASFSEVHANFIVNYGNAKASDLLALTSLAIERVEKKFGKTLELEIKIIGEM